MKTKLYYLLSLFTIVTICLFSSCDKDDNDSDNEGGITGTWEWKQSSEYINTLKFSSKGTFTEIEKEYYKSTKKWETTTNTGTYEYDGEELILKYNDGDIEYLEVLELTSDKLELGNWWGDRTVTFHRI